METDRAAIATTQAEEEKVSRSQTDRESASFDRHNICSEDRNTMAILAAGTRLWFRDDLLAEIKAVAEGRGLEETAPSIVSQTAGSGQDRLVTSCCGRFQCTCRFWGAKTGSNPTDRRKLGSKHHLIADRQGIPLATILTSAHLVDAIAQVRGRVGPLIASGVIAAPSLAPRPWYRSGIGQTTNRAWQWLGCISLGGRKDALLVAPISPFAYSI